MHAPRVIAALVAAAGLTAGTGAALADPPGGPHTPVEICHKPGTPAEHALVVDDDAVPGHLGHGDSVGACAAVTPPTHGCGSAGSGSAGSGSAGSGSAGSGFAGSGFAGSGRWPGCPIGSRTARKREPCAHGLRACIRPTLGGRNDEPPGFSTPGGFRAIGTTVGTVNPAGMLGMPSVHT